MSVIEWPAVVGYGQLPFGRVFEKIERAPKIGAEMVTAYTDGTVTLRSRRSKVGYHEAANMEGYQGVESGDFVVHGLDILRGSVGTSDSAGVITRVCSVCRPIKPVDLRFVAYAIRTQAQSGYTQAMARGIREGGADFRRWGTLAELPLPFPPLDDQQAIADYLDRETQKIDELITEQRGLIETLLERRQAVVRRATTLGVDGAVDFVDSGVNWLGPIRADAELIRLRFLADVNTGHGDTQDADPDGAYPFYVRSETVESSKKYDYVGPAVLTSGDGAGVGKVFHFVADSRFMAHQRVYVMDHFQNVDARYFFYAFSAHFALVALDGSARSTVDSVRRHMITNFPVVVPSLDWQRRVVEYLDEQTARIDELISESEDLIALSQERRVALITAAVTGQIDVRTAV